MSAAGWPAHELRITGRVQGVGFRWHLVQEARRLGVDGWVRNRPDGSVQAVCRGAPQAVQALTDWAHQGPVHARVQRVEVLPWAGDPVPTGFAQRDT